MAENANPLVTAKTERGFYYIKRENAGQVPAELADQMFTSLDMAERAIIAFEARKEAAEAEKKAKKNTEE